MVIGGGSRRKDRGQWEGWGLEEPRKKPGTAGGLKFVDLHPLESTYINKKRRTKLLVVGVGKGVTDRYFTNQTFDRRETLPARATCLEGRAVKACRRHH